ncbi:hypothetical protein Hdeb2414_s0013g00408761 [Helianthus debilis subsp. tardiflorus]
MLNFPPIQNFGALLPSLIRLFCFQLRIGRIKNELLDPAKYVPVVVQATRRHLGMWVYGDQTYVDHIQYGIAKEL